MPRASMATTQTQTPIAKPVAPEDLRPETYVSVMSITIELLWCDEGAPWSRPGLIRTTWLPGADAGTPLRVVSICLPFVLVEQPTGAHQTLDVRRFRFAQLTGEFGRKAFKRLGGGAAKRACPTD
jgi:hypothetical protein